MRLTGDTLSTLREVRLEPLEPRQLLAFGQLDQTFGTGGHASAAVGSVTSTPALQDIEIAPDGGLVAGGSGGLVRWTADGDVDADFGFEGVVPLPGATYHDHDVAPDGDIVLLVSNGSGGVVVRYTSDGQLDDTFGIGGSTLISVGAAFSPSAVAVQGDGKVIVAGAVRTDMGKGSRARVYRLDPDGSADMAFGNGASIDLNFGRATALTPVVKDTVTGVTVLSGGKIVLAGSALSYAPEVYIDEANVFNPVVYGDSVFATARLTTSGLPDASYGEGGVARAVYASGTLPAPASAFAHKPVDDAIGLAAYTDRLVYAQFNASGVVAFNRSAELSSFGRPLDMAAKRDGRFMLVGASTPLTGHGLQVTYVHPDGQLANVVHASSGSGGLMEPDRAAIAVAADGDILVGGRPGEGLAGYRVLKMDEGKVDAERPDEFAAARGNDLVRDGSGALHLAFFDATERVLRYAYRAPDGLWNAPVTVDAAPESGHYLSIAVNGDGRPGIAYFDGNAGDLKYAFSARGGQWTTGLVESGGIVGLYPSLQFDTSLRPTIAYYKKTGGDLKLAVLQPEGSWTYELVDATSDVGRAAALVPQPISGRWSIAYTDTTTGAVKFAWRTRSRVWAIETAANTLGGADYLSLAYNPSTEPAGVYLRAAISYFDAYAADVKLTQSSGDGALVWADRVLATQGMSGMYSHLTFDAFHGPTVYYYNRTADRVTRLTDSYTDGVSAETLVQGAGRHLSVFSDGATVDVAFFDEDEQVLKVRSIPVRV